ncbi:MAG: DUF4385 domain-containing protein [Cryobacterium sp.]|nr:DUF4385 domain-containing protein [Oligoflexia bacterium]
MRLVKRRVTFKTLGIDFRKYPERYRIAKGEQGVLSVEPYKAEILPYWKFRTPEIATQSVRDLMKLFRTYRKKKDFVGMDMTRKFLQMGYTRSRRYANHRSGHKYIGPVPRNLKGVSGAHGRAVAPREPDLLKAKSAEIFRSAWELVEKDRLYKAMRLAWKSRFG